MRLQGHEAGPTSRLAVSLFTCVCLRSSVLRCGGAGWVALSAAAVLLNHRPILGSAAPLPPPRRHLQDFSGTLEVDELVKAAKEVLPDLDDQEIQRMFSALDSDHTGTVDVREFFAGLLSSMSEDKLATLAQKSFTMLDRQAAHACMHACMHHGRATFYPASDALPATFQLHGNCMHLLAQRRQMLPLEVRVTEPPVQCKGGC